MHPIAVALVDTIAALAQLSQRALDERDGHGSDESAGPSLIQVRHDIEGGHDQEVDAAADPLHRQRSRQLRDEGLQ